MENILEVKGLCKSFAGFSLKDVALFVPKGCVMGLIGENGAGKTTLIRLILGQLQRDAGEIKVFGLDNRKQEKQIKQDVGVVFEELFNYFFLSPEKLGKVFQDIYQNWDGADYQRYLKRFQIPEKKPIKELSKGMRMKLSISVALSHHPKLLLLDEATSGLDPVVRGEVLDEFQDFLQEEDRGILFSSHITDDLERIADYITFLHQGKILFSMEKDVLMETHGIARGSEEELGKLPREWVVGVRRHRFGCEALVTQRQEVARLFPRVAVDPAHLNELMAFYTGGKEE